MQTRTQNKSAQWQPKNRQDAKQHGDYASHPVTKLRALSDAKRRISAAKEAFEKALSDNSVARFLDSSVQGGGE